MQFFLLFLLHQQDSTSHGPMEVNGGTTESAPRQGAGGKELGEEPAEGTSTAGPTNNKATRGTCSSDQHFMAIMEKMKRALAEISEVRIY